MFYEVMPTEVYRSGGGALTYSSDLTLQPGQIVLIPLGRKVVTGIIWKKVPKVDFPTKPITKLLCPFPIPKHLLKSISWLSEYYLSPLPLTANLMVPAGIAAKTALKSISPENKNTPKSPLEASEHALPQKSLTTKHKPNTCLPELSDASRTQSGTKLPKISLNSAQKVALKELQSIRSSTRLLRGITGSGKTNIYLSLAYDILTKGQSVTLLVPEIALTSQLVQIFERTFGSQVILMHSRQTMSERRRIWLEIISNNSPRVIIGPRSALLAPLHNLGLIIIDEAHESAYYQENPPRYSALRLASFIASTRKIPCILGTATPNLFDYHLAKTHHSLIELTQKAKTTAINHHITIIDLKNRDNFTKNRYFSTPLLTAIEKNIQAKHQTLIFHNRRGSAPLTLCENCGWQALCPECFLPMTLHTDNYTLVCHVCGHSEKVPTSCPDCGHPEVIHKGFGTKLLESELKIIFPTAKIARFDGDNTKDDDLANLYNEVKAGEIDILIGTQTLARGLDLPHLATVGIIQADAGLALPDFASEERTFELLTQVIGRVGRGHLDKAEVFVQSFQPDHPVIRTAIQADYPKFADFLLHKRHEQQMPPFTYLARLSVTYKTERTTLAKIRQAYTALSQNRTLDISPPMPAFHERTGRGFTWQIVIKSSSREQLRQALVPYAGTNGFTLVLDPPSLL